MTQVLKPLTTGALMIGGIACAHNVRLVAQLLEAAKAHAALKGRGACDTRGSNPSHEGLLGESRGLNSRHDQRRGSPRARREAPKTGETATNPHRSSERRGKEKEKENEKDAARTRYIYPLDALAWPS